MAGDLNKMASNHEYIEAVQRLGDTFQMCSFLIPDLYDWQVISENKTSLMLYFYPDLSKFVEVEYNGPTDELVYSGNVKLLLGECIGDLQIEYLKQCFADCQITKTLADPIPFSLNPDCRIEPRKFEDIHDGSIDYSDFLNDNLSITNLWNNIFNKNGDNEDET